MTYEQVLAEAKALPVEERRRLMREIATSLRDEGEIPVPRGVPASRLHGIIKFDGPPPTDEELREDYINYLIEKYR